MKRIIISEMVSLDGFFAGSEGQIDWHVVDEEFNQFAIDLLSTVDTILFGRVTYQLFESYWPAALKNPSTSPSDLKIAQKITEASKIVFSRTISETNWKNVRVRKELNAEKILETKKMAGKNIIVYGSGSIVSTLMKMDLIDEYLLFYNPIVLGTGKPLFKDIERRHNLELVNNHVFKSGVVLLQYRSLSTK